MVGMFGVIMFKDDIFLEERFYNEIFKPWLNGRGNDSIFIRYNTNNIIYETLQKKHDIDIVLDNGKENITLSLKTVRKIYNRIFFETISNCNKETPGWGYYSKADQIIYSMGDFQNGFISKAFKISDIIILNINEYPKGYGRTFNNENELLYETEGRLIPFKDFKHVLLFDQRKGAYHL